MKFESKYKLCMLMGFPVIHVSLMCDGNEVANLTTIVQRPYEPEDRLARRITNEMTRRYKRDSLREAQAFSIDYTRPRREYA